MVGLHVKGRIAEDSSSTCKNRLILGGNAPPIVSEHQEDKVSSMKT